MAGQWRRQTRKQQQIGAGAGSQIVAEVFDAVNLVGSPPSSPVAGTLYRMLYGWLNFKDVAGTITVNGRGGNIVLTPTFRTGTATGDYTITSGTAFADAFWVLGGIARAAAGQSCIVELNPDNPLHSTTQLNINTQSPSAGALVRVSECLIWAVGAAPNPA